MVTFCFLEGIGAMGHEYALYNGQEGVIEQRLVSPILDGHSNCDSNHWVVHTSWCHVLLYSTGQLPSSKPDWLKAPLVCCIIVVVVVVVAVVVVVVALWWCITLLIVSRFGFKASAICLNCKWSEAWSYAPLSSWQCKVGRCFILRPAIELTLCFNLTLVDADWPTSIR